MTRPKAYHVPIKPLDVLAFLLALGVIVALSIAVYAHPRKNPVAVVSSPKGRWILPLSTPQVVTPTSREDGCVVSILIDSVRVLRSGCPEQICVRAGSISRPGQWIACLPHGVVIRIQGFDDDPLDAIVF